MRRPNRGAARAAKARHFFSSEVETGSRQENASKQESGAPLRFYRSAKCSSALLKSAPTLSREGLRQRGRERHGVEFPAVLICDQESVRDLRLAPPDSVGHKLTGGPQSLAMGRRQIRQVQAFLIRNQLIACLEMKVESSHSAHIDQGVDVFTDHSFRLSGSAHLDYVGMNFLRATPSL